MKKILLTILLLAVALITHAEGYDSIHAFNEYHKGWALVEKNGLFGFIDKSGTEVVPVVYSKISYFDEYHKGLAMVERNGKKGFIDRKGREIVSP